MALVWQLDGTSWQFDQVVEYARSYAWYYRVNLDSGTYLVFSDVPLEDEGEGAARRHAGE